MAKILRVISRPIEATESDINAWKEELEGRDIKLRRVATPLPPIARKVATVLPADVTITRVNPGKAHGLETPKMRATGERGTEARLPPPKSKKRSQPNGSR